MLKSVLKNRCKRVLAFLMALMVLFTSVPAYAADDTNTDADENAVTAVAAPGGDVKIYFWLDEAGTPYYKVESNGKILIEDSKMGLVTSLGDLKDGFSITAAKNSSGDTTWQPIVGEQETIRDHYNETIITLSHEESGCTLGIALRAYDEGIAFQYLLPELPNGTESYTISDEYTQFVFPEGTMSSLHVGANQTVPKEYAVESFPSGNIYRPSTFEYTDGQVLTICEANVDNYGVMVMEKDSETARALNAKYVSYKGRYTETEGPENEVDADGPAVTPWRALAIGDDPTNLAENSNLIMNLNEAPDEETYGFSEWVDPGTCLRAASGMNTTAIKGIVDQAEENQIRYVLLDTGWYGPEFDANCDPRLDPSKLDLSVESDAILMENYFATEGGYNDTGEGVFNTNGVGFNVYGKVGDSGTFNTNVDIPEICSYANSKGVGIILYVNGVFFPDGSGRDRFTADDLFTYFEKWGVAGVKPGFVNCRAQEFEKNMEEVIAAAAKHKLILTIHDEYVTTGIERTYPNLMEVEGILGDEGIKSHQIAEDITTLFTRTIQGPADHTYCYPGKGTKAYALASPIMFRSGMSVLYWYTNPNGVPSQDKVKMDIWDDLPTNWKQTLYLEGKLYEYATFARKSYEDEWYVGSLSAVDRTLKISLDFLDANTVYVADVYADGIDADATASSKNNQILENNKYLVTSDTVLERTLSYGWGYAVKLTKATEEDQAAYSVYNAYRQELELEIQRAETLTEGNYTTESWSAFETALTTAQQLVADENAEDEALENARITLKETRESLVSTEALDEAIQRAENYTSYHYTEESYAKLAEAMEAGQVLLDSGAFTQAQLDEAEAAIMEAIENLVGAEDMILKEVIYLSDLNCDSSKSSAYSNNIVKDKNRANGTLTLMIDGVATTFARGMGFHAQADIYYDIEGLGLEIFQGYVGVDAEKSTQGDIIFRIYGDGILLYESEPSGTGFEDAQFFSVPVAGVKELYLESNINGSNNGDWADWADAKFLIYQDPDAYLNGITVDGSALPQFDEDTYEYYCKINDDGSIPAVDVVLAADDFTYEIIDAEAVNEYTEILITTRDGGTLTYKVYFFDTVESDYISDLSSLIIKNTLHATSVAKDKDYKGGSIVLTAEDGTSQLPFEKGIGTHASSSTDSMVVYNIEGKDFDRFEGYVGIRYATHEEEIASGYTTPRSKVNFKIYVDDEATPRFESGAMTTRTPAVYYNVDVHGSKTLTLVVDACGDQSADHGCWGYARFSKYDYPSADYTKVNEAIAAAEALDETLYKDFSGVEAALAAVDTEKYFFEQETVDAMATAIMEAIGKLEYKDADYSKVEEAIAEVEALNRDLYKDLTAVDAAVAAVVRGKDITEQAAVDAMATAIIDAIGNLIPKPENPFEDVLEEHFFYDPVLWALDMEITEGTSETTFEPFAECTRANVVTFLWRANGCPEPETVENPFVDIAEDAYYYKAILWAAEKGITDGTSKTAFSPDDTCTRAQIVTFLWREAGKPEPASDTCAFEDVSDLAYYRDAVLWAVEKGITQGKSDTAFDPDAICNRGETVTFLYRAVNGTNE